MLYDGRCRYRDKIIRLRLVKGLYSGHTGRFMGVVDSPYYMPHTTVFICLFVCWGVFVCFCLCLRESAISNNVIKLDTAES